MVLHNAKSNHGSTNWTPWVEKFVQSATEVLAQEAWKRWIQEEGNVVDDITVIIVWLNP